METSKPIVKDTNGIDKQLLRLVFKYQRTHPDQLEEDTSGRISLVGRKLLTQEAIELFVKDKDAAQIFINPKLSAEEMSQNLAEHMLKRNAGDRQKASDEATILLKNMEYVSASKESELSRLNLLRSERIIQLPDGQRNNFIMDTRHMGLTMLLQWRWTLSDAIKIIKPEES